MLFIILGIILAFIFICFIIFKSKQYINLNKPKGAVGEKIVSKVLGTTIPGEQYVINDLLFSIDEGKSCQIDHIFINKNAVWVIETKNYSGYIQGKENQREWVQVLYNGERNTFYNPIKQNATHIYHLSKILNDKYVFQNVVVFLKGRSIANLRASNVYNIYELGAIKHKETGMNLSKEEMEKYYNKLLELKNNSTISRAEHVGNIHNMQKKIMQGICPRCGGNLVLRNGKYGKFYGCSNFPSCRFKKNIDRE